MFSGLDWHGGKRLRRQKFLLVLVVWMVIFGGRISDLNRLTNEFEQAQETMAALTATTRALATEVVRADSDAAVEQWAYENRRWIREGDHRIAVVPLEGTQILPTLIPTVTQQPQNMFRVWWDLFFNTKP
jgi:cell division protein FtsB